MSTNRRVCLGLSISHVVIGLVTVVVLLLELEKIKLDILDLTAGKTQEQIIQNAHSLISRIGKTSPPTDGAVLDRPGHRANPENPA